MGIKVCKFGGTSMANAEAMKRARDIVLSDKERKFVVVSAPGKRTKSDEKITDLLIRCQVEAKESGDCSKTFAIIEERFVEIVKDLGLDFDILNVLKETKKEINANCETKDFAASRGEYLSARIFACLLGFEFVDSADLVLFDEDGKFDSEGTNYNVGNVLEKVEKAVIPGFYGKTYGRKIKIFSRGGSDISGSIVARGVNADIYENWTDVCGVLACDPRIVDNPKKIDRLSYKELRELSYMGASVLHADAIFPVRKGRIPINIKNTFEPSDSGTFILPTEKYTPTGDLITGIAGMKGFTVIFIDKSMMNSELGFARKVLEVLESNKISFEHMPSGIDTMSIVVSKAEVDGRLDKVIDEIKQAVKPDHIFVKEDISLIATVGHGMANKIGTSARLFTALSKAKINVLLIDQGSSELNIIVGVKDSDYEDTVRAIYNEFFCE